VTTASASGNGSASGGARGLPACMRAPQEGKDDRAAGVPVRVDARRAVGRGGGMRTNVG
jgi:hypothetical protein